MNDQDIAPNSKWPCVRYGSTGLIRGAAQGSLIQSIGNDLAQTLSRRPVLWHPLYVEVGGPASFGPEGLGRLPETLARG